MKNMRHLGVYGIIIKNDKIALILKSRGAYKGKLDFPGGSIEDDERPCDTLVREIKEEFNADVKSFQIFDSESVVVDWKYEEELVHMHHIGIYYKVTLKDNNLKSDADGYDSLGANWYKIDKLKENEVSPLVWIILNKLNRENKK